jgi:hypothetical protein
MDMLIVCGEEDLDVVVEDYSRSRVFGIWVYSCRDEIGRMMRAKTFLLRSEGTYKPLWCNEYHV